MFNCRLCVEKTPPVVTLYGDEYLSYDLSRKADTIVSNSDSTSLYFKTSQTNALLFYTGNAPRCCYNKEIVDSRLRKFACSPNEAEGSPHFCLWHAHPCDFSVGFPTSRHCLFTNNCHAYWHAIGEIRSGHEILARGCLAQIIYAGQTYRQTDCNTSLSLAGEVILL